MQLSGNERLDLLTSRRNMSLALRLPRKIHLCKSSSHVPGLPSFLEMLQNPYVLLTFDKVHNPLHLPRESTSERPKVVRGPGVFNILTSKCASRHNGVHFFDIATSLKGVRTWGALYILTSRHNGVHFLDISISKSAPSMVCFVHFDFEICFTPQRRPLFPHLNFQKWSERAVFCTCWLRNLLRTTTCDVFSFFACKRASRHTGVHFFDISTYKSAPSVRCF